MKKIEYQPKQVRIFLTLLALLLVLLTLKWTRNFRISWKEHRDDPTRKNGR